MAFIREMLPPPRVFYRRELEKIGRESRGWVRALCPFHEDHNPSLSVNMGSGGFYCFSCGAKGGDVVDFVMLRYHLDFKAAATMVGAWTDGDDPRELRRLQQQRKDERARKEQLQEERRRKRIDTVDFLHLLECLYENTSQRLTQLHHGATEVYRDEAEALWYLLALLHPIIRRVDANYCRLIEVPCE